MTPPKLPIPPLKDTLERYLNVLKPLQTTKDHAVTREKVNAFMTQGEVINQKLIEFASTRDSYIEEFWFDAYLDYDDPVVLNLNPYFLLEDDPTPGITTQCHRAASLTTSALKFVKTLREGTMEPDKVGSKELSMDQYTRLFGTARIPTSNGHCYIQTDSTSHHLVVLCHGEFYWFDVLDKDNNPLWTIQELEYNLKAVVKDAESTKHDDATKTPTIGVLGTENRKAWANLRHKLKIDNGRNLKILDSALFILVLDDITAGDDMERTCKNLLCGLTDVREDGVQYGTCTNRWYDKLQIIVTLDGKAGINFEHTGVDGHTVLRLASDLYTDSILRFAMPKMFENPRRRSADTNVVTIPRKLEWDLSSELLLSLRFAETRLSDLINQSEFITLDFQKYGSTQIKKFKTSPDAFVQMAFQATYYSLYGKVETTYEPAMTKMFLNGRTEAIRTVSEESVDFVRGFFNRDVSAAEKVRLLREACNRHSTRSKECAMGLGQDRHLYALYCIWDRYFKDKMPLPSIFTDKGWDKLGKSVLSTSNCGNPCLKSFGFGPVCSEGLGLAYIIKEDSLAICVCSKHRQTRRFVTTLEKYFLEIQRVFELYEDEHLTAVSTPVEGKSTSKTNVSNDQNMTYLLGGYSYFDIPDLDDIKTSVMGNAGTVQLAEY